MYNCVGFPQMTFGNNDMKYIEQNCNVQLHRFSSNLHGFWYKSPRSQVEHYIHSELRRLNLFVMFIKKRSFLKLQNYRRHSTHDVQNKE